MHGVRTVNIASPTHDVDASVADLSRLIGSRPWACVLPLDDDAVRLLDQKGGGSTAVPVAGPAGALRELALDKRLQVEAAREASFQVPPTVIVETPDPLLPTDIGNGPLTGG